MDIYKYTRSKQLFIGQTTAREDPLQPGEFLIPANATTVPPPVTSANQIAQWTGVSWFIIPDFRGTEYWLPDGTHHIIDEVDVIKPVDALDAPPPPVPLTTDEIYDLTIQNEKVLKAIVLALNDGSLVPGANVTNAVLKATIKAKM